MKFDFHCHTNCSDGTLSPEQLVNLALERQVEVLAITDHDSVAAYKQFPPGNHQLGQTEERSLTLISGCEFSAVWNGQLVHIVGLDFDLDDAGIQSLLAETLSVRRVRCEKIASALEKVGIEGALDGAQKFAASGVPGRPHFARYLVESGRVPNEKKAFKKYLGNGRPGDIRVDWPELSQVVEAIVRAGGLSIIAHPVHYKMSRTKLLRLVDDFQSFGGRALEVVSGKQPSNQIQQLVQIANDRNMLCSAGSDFHQPNQPWADLGKAALLPKAAVPVWTECKSLS